MKKMHARTADEDTPEAVVERCKQVLESCRGHLTLGVGEDLPTFVILLLRLQHALDAATKVFATATNATATLSSSAQVSADFKDIRDLQVLSSPAQINLLCYLERRALLVRA